MAKDYANRASQKRHVRPPIPGWILFLTGLTLGVFIAFLVYLAKFTPIDKDLVVGPVPMPSAVKLQAANNTEIEWHFYEIFPNLQVPVVEEFIGEDEKILANPARYVLQAGSFRNAEQAEHLRAELILLGLEVITREFEVNSERWHRVIVGPLDSDLELTRTQDVLAEAEIESIPLRIKP